MGLLAQQDYDVSLDHVGDLLTLALVDYLLVVSCPLDYLKIKVLSFLDDLASFTLSTVFLVHSSLSTALVARLLHLHLHETHVLYHFHHSLALALIASHRLSTLGTRSLALSAVDVALDLE